MSWRLASVVATASLLFAAPPAAQAELVACAHCGDAPAELVNPLMGTDSERALSYGSTYPAVSRPWGMNAWTPQTSKNEDGWIYQYPARKIVGLRLTHQPSPWLGDYGAISLMATVGPLKVGEEGRGSAFSHKAEVAKPYYYRVYLADHDVTAEVAPTSHAARLRFTFPDAEQANVLLDAFAGGSSVAIDASRRRVTGWTRNNHGGTPANFREWFVAEFDHPFLTPHSWTGDGAPSAASKAEGDHVGAAVSFRTRRGEQVGVRIATSFVSLEQAERNLKETDGRDFDALVAEGARDWNAALGRVRIQDGDIDHLRTFYSCLYRMLLFPRPLDEIDAEGRTIHYSPYDGRVHPGTLSTDNGFWDTFRAVFPFYTLVYPERDRQVMQGLVNTYRESGWLPEWASPGHRDIMIGSNSAPIIADAWLKGIGGYDIDALYEAMKKNATTSAGRPTGPDGKPLRSVGREGVERYVQLGYVPYDSGVNENVARTLEYANADFAVARLAQALGKSEDATTFFLRARNYRKVYDPKVGWMRGRNSDGSFQSPFNVFKWGDAFTEGNSLHYSWSVLHDVQGLIDLMGGDTAFVKKLDDVFTTPPVFDASYYGETIHEIREMQLVDMGNYAHGNEPIQHMIYLYDYAGQPWKAQAHVREVLSKLYSATPDGYPGDEDNGQTSAWYVFSALGFYPVTPASGQYVIGSPLFSRVDITLPDDRRLTIKADNVSKANVFIQKLSLNGRPYDRTWLDHRDLAKGGTVDFVMGPKPDPTWGSRKADAPFSMTERK